MTLEDFKEALRASVYKNYYIMQKTLPYKTGKLAYQAFKIRELGDGKFDIYIDLSISPYAEYIDRPGYKTFGFWDNSIKEFLEAVAKDLGGTLQ